MLNTNTRYLHATIVELAERIVASMPDGLDTVMFVNSGSEANDLAWRLATIATGADAGLVTDWAYHGVTAAIVDFSPSEWPRGERPDGVETFPAPDTYRGPYAGRGRPARLGATGPGGRGGPPGGTGASTGRPVRRLLFTSAGIFTPDPPVVAATLQAARDAGALLVADEVQSGHGRSGDGLWRFPAWGVTPDVVTLGKPMGNGHPIAAVVTRGELADCMAQAKTAFFSTFGGNPVACIAALTVLDVLEDERLVEHAAEVGGLAARRAGRPGRPASGHRRRPRARAHGRGRAGRGGEDGRRPATWRARCATSCGSAACWSAPPAASRTC